MGSSGPQDRIVESASVLIRFGLQGKRALRAPAGHCNPRRIGQPLEFLHQGGSVLGDPPHFTSRRTCNLGRIKR